MTLNIVEQWAHVDDLWQVFLTHTVAVRRRGPLGLVGLSLREIHDELRETRDQIPSVAGPNYAWVGFEKMSAGVSRYVLDKLEAEILATLQGKTRPALPFHAFDNTALHNLRHVVVFKLRTDMAGLWQSLVDLEVVWRRNRWAASANAWVTRREDVEELLRQAKIARKLPTMLNQSAPPGEAQLLPHQIQALQLYIDTVLVEPLEALVQAIRIHYGAEAGAFHGLPERGRP